MFFATEIELLNCQKLIQMNRSTNADVTTSSGGENKPMLAAVLGGIWEGFKTLIAWLFIIYIILFIVVGGEFSISVKWENIVELWRVLNGS